MSENLMQHTIWNNAFRWGFWTGALISGVIVWLVV